MYRLVFDSYLDRVMRHRGTSRRHTALWYPDRSTAERAAERMRALGQAVSIEKLGEALGTTRVTGRAFGDTGLPGASPAGASPVDAAPADAAEENAPASPEDA